MSEEGIQHTAACMFFRQGFPATINHFEASRLYREAAGADIDPIAHASAAQIDDDAHRATVTRLTARVVQYADVLREQARRSAEIEAQTQASRDAARSVFPEEWAASESMTDGRARREAQRLLRRRIETAHA